MPVINAADGQDRGNSPMSTYNNPVYHNDFRDHIDRRDSVVEVKNWHILMKTFNFPLVSCLDHE